MSLSLAWLLFPGTREQPTTFIFQVYAVAVDARSHTSFLPHCHHTVRRRKNLLRAGLDWTIHPASSSQLFCKYTRDMCEVNSRQIHLNYASEPEFSEGQHQC